MANQKETPATESGPMTGSKSPKGRSPNYPALDLKTLVDKLPSIFESMKRHAVGVEVAVKAMGYSYSSSTGKLALASMRAFGLFENERSGADAMVKLSTTALDIAVDYPRESQDWWAAVKRAALAPNIHQVLWKKYGASLPPDDELRRFLVRELKFTDIGVGSFIQQYKSAIAFSKLSEGDIKATEDDDPEALRGEVQIGSLIQWTSAGIDQFPQPKKVVGIKGDWLFVEDGPTGIPMSEIKIVAATAPLSNLPPANPFFKTPKLEDEPTATGSAKEITTLEEGPVTLTLPKVLSADSVDDLEYWVEGILKKYRRSSGTAGRK